MLKEQYTEITESCQEIEMFTANFAAICKIIAHLPFHSSKKHCNVLNILLNLFECRKLTRSDKWDMQKAELNIFSQRFMK